MAQPQEFYTYGTSFSPLVDETPAVLVDSLTINFPRDNNEYQNLNGTTTRLKLTNPTATFDYSGKIAAESNLAIQHPGTLCSSLQNFQSELNGFDPLVGIMVFLDPSRSMNETDDFIGYSFQVKHYPFIEHDDGE